MTRYKSSRKSHASDVLSTKEAAVVCKVALSTIVYWFDKGLIRGYRTPGGHRRIFRSDLEKFMNEHAMPLGHRLPDGQVRVLLAARDPGLLRSYGALLDSMEDRVQWVKAKTEFEAGRKISAFHPDVLIIDLRLPGADAASLCEDLRTDPETQTLEIVALGDPAEAPGIEALAARGLCELLSRTPDQNRLSAAIFRGQAA